jgi:hypothetical protein
MNNTHFSLGKTDAKNAEKIAFLRSKSAFRERECLSYCPAKNDGSFFVVHLASHRGGWLNNRANAQRIDSQPALCSRLHSASGYPLLELVDLRVVRTTIATEVITGIQRFGGPKLEKVSGR